MVDTRDKRDPEQLYQDIQRIMESNPGMSITAAADLANVEQRFNGEISGPNGNGKVS